MKDKLKKGNVYIFKTVKKGSTTSVWVCNACLTPATHLLEFKEGIYYLCVSV